MNKFQWNFIWISYIYIQENAFEKVVCEMAAILSRPQCVNFLISTMSADGLTSPNDKIFAGTMMVKFGSYMYGKPLEQSKSILSCKNAYMKLKGRGNMYLTEYVFESKSISILFIVVTLLCVAIRSK